MHFVQRARMRWNPEARHEWATLQGFNNFPRALKDRSTTRNLLPCSASISLNACEAEKKSFPPFFWRNPSRSPTLPAFRHSLSPVSYYWHLWCCWPQTGSWHQGNCNPQGGRERLTVTSLHCMTGEVSADLITGSLTVPALSIYLGIFHETIDAMRVAGRTPAPWSMRLCKHFQWVVTYFIFKPDCPTLHRGTQCALKREGGAQKLGSVSSVSPGSACSLFHRTGKFPHSAELQSSTTSEAAHVLNDRRKKIYMKMTEKSN